MNKNEDITRNLQSQIVNLERQKEELLCGLIGGDKHKLVWMKDLQKIEDNIDDLELLLDVVGDEIQGG